MLNGPGPVQRKPTLCSFIKNAWIERLVRLILCRQTVVADREMARGFLAADHDHSTPWRSFVQALLMANEFVFVD